MKNDRPGRITRREFLKATLGAAGAVLLGGCETPTPPASPVPAPGPPPTASLAPPPGPPATTSPVPTVEPSATASPILAAPTPASPSPAPPAPLPTGTPDSTVQTPTPPPALPSTTRTPTPMTPTSTGPPVIRGYPERPSVRPGDILMLHVSTNAARFHVAIYRQTTTRELMRLVTGLAGAFRPDRRASEDFAWPVYPVPIPADWPSGAYIAQCIPDGPGAAAAATGEILFVVLPAQPGRTAHVLYKLPLATYHAYNCTGDSLAAADPHRASLYVNPIPSTHPAGIKVTMHRPGGGIGGASCEPDDAYDRSSPRQTFAHWDLPMVRWLAAEGLAVDYCTDLDLHEDAALLGHYKLLLSVGHDEYWSAALRSGVESFLDQGGNVAFFSGNVCWWRIQYVDDNTAIVCNKANGQDNWFHSRPENTLTGVSYRSGGGKWLGERVPLGYTVEQAEHWIYAGTGLRAGDVFGQHSTPPLVGYECDGARFARNPQGLAVPTGQDGTPAGFVILGTAVLDPHAQPAWDERRGQSTATLGLYTRNGTAFTAATTDWPKVLAADPVAATITRNVIARLGSRPK